MAIQGPGQTPGKTTPPVPEDDDLVLVADDGRVYWLKKADYMDEKFRVSQEARLTDQIDFLSKQGVLLADVPATSSPGVGAACFLVNLRAIRRQSSNVQSSNVQGPTVPSASPRPPRPPRPRGPPKPDAQDNPLRAEEADGTTGGLHS